MSALILKGSIDFTSIRTSKKGSIENFMDGMSETWPYWRDKHDWKCVKVDIEFILKP